MEMKEWAGRYCEETHPFLAILPAGLIQGEAKSENVEKDKEVEHGVFEDRETAEAMDERSVANEG